ncbi:hypothetical protein VTJ04DRAFT_7622 [Mycothermus thermophilus]|uniref:uncharacterized protein n=1 Tax=Humicola insolens TaxID=85995 RepID=UPI00374248E8
MADMTATRAAAAVEHAANGAVLAASARPEERPNVPLNQIYVLPVPIRTFPLPTFFPNNPISLLYLAIAWLRQILRPPAAEPSVVHTGVWDPETRSVHIKEEPSIRALWEQGFYGKGSLSRSEPNWLKRELARRGSSEGKTVSEARTEQRREERRQAKWERAKAELEAIERQRRLEAEAQAAAAAAAATAASSSLSSSSSEAVPNGVERELVEPEALDGAAVSVAITSDVEAQSVDAVEKSVPSASVEPDSIEAAPEDPEPVLGAGAHAAESHDAEPQDAEPGEAEPHDLEPHDAEIHDSEPETSSDGDATPAVEEPSTSESALLPTHSTWTPKPPTGPIELLALPNSLAEVNQSPSGASGDALLAEPQPEALVEVKEQEEQLDVATGPEDVNAPLNGQTPKQFQRGTEVKAPVGPAELLALPNSLVELKAMPVRGVDELATGPAATEPEPEIPVITTEPKAPVGPIELLQLPNSHADLTASLQNTVIVPEPTDSTPAPSSTQDILGDNEAIQAPRDDIIEKVSELEAVVADVPEVQEPSLDEDGVEEITADDEIIPQPQHDTIEKVSVAEAVVADVPKNQDTSLDQDCAEETADEKPADEEPADDKAVNEQPTCNGNGAQLNGANGEPATPVLLPVDDSAEATAVDTESPTPTKCRKSVRFSPTVESTTFAHSDPPSPKYQRGVAPKIPVVPIEDKLDPSAIVNKEHFQLSPEEAFFLTFALGVLKVVDPATGSPISTEHLLSLFRSHSYFPPRPVGAPLRPDDPFLVHYAVYHHFRSLGWVPRHGIKFGVDWIIYQRGPVFDHSEFGIMVMPAYSDPGWENEEHEEPRRPWSWLMGVNRVLSHVLKSLVLVYVDIPSPAVFEQEMQKGGVAAVLKKYTIREVMVRRFSVNRNR